MPIVVIGMHRSGMPMVAHTLNRAGVRLGVGANMTAAREGNDNSNGEHPAIGEINERILTSLGGRWNDPPSFPPNWLDLPRIRRIMADAAVFVADTFDPDSTWGWIDPRTSLTLPFWRRVVPDIRAVVCVRNPLDVAESLQAGEAVSTTHALTLWQVYTEAALQNTRPEERIIVPYDELIAGTPSAGRRLRQFIGYSQIEPAPEVSLEREGSMDARLQHRHSLNDVMIDPTVPSDVKLLYGALHYQLDLVDMAFPGPGEENLTEARDRVAGGEEAFADTERMFPPGRAELQERLIDLEEQVADRDAQLQELAGRITTWERHWAGVQGTRAWKAVLLLRRARRVIAPEGTRRERLWISLRRPPSPEASDTTGSNKHTRVLVIDDRVPDRRLGSGFPRTEEMVLALNRSGHFVTYLPVVDPTAYEPATSSLQDAGIEVLSNVTEVEDKLASRAGLYEVAIVSRPHNARWIAAIRRTSPDTAVIYDAEAVFSLRDAGQRQVEGVPVGEEDVNDAIRRELAPLRSVDLVMTVSERDREIIQRYRPQPEVVVWGHPAVLYPHGRPFSTRGDLLFVGYLGSGPNNDAALFLLQKIVPLLNGRYRRIVVAGDDPSRELRIAARQLGRKARLPGFVTDLQPVYEHARVFVAPHRFAAGIPLKVVEAMAHGLPCVISPLLADQLGLQDGEGISVARSAEEFAAKITALWMDVHLWERMRQAALDIAATRWDVDAMEQALSGYVARAVSKHALTRDVSVTASRSSYDAAEPRHTIG